MNSVYMMHFLSFIVVLLSSASSAQTLKSSFFAVADHHGYKTTPVSTLLISGREPGLVFQKQLNTFAKRHHIRIWATDPT